MQTTNEHSRYYTDIRKRLMGASLLARFTVLGGAIVILEAVLGSWPVVATSIWAHHAVDTWIHFLYWIKAFFLALAVLQTRWKPWRFTHNRPALIDRELGILDLCVGATASCELSTWIRISIIVHALLSSIVLLLVLVLQHEFESNTEWILGLVFNAVAIAESVGSPLILLNFGLQPYFQEGPTLFQSERIASEAKAKAQQQQMEAEALFAAYIIPAETEEEIPRYSVATVHLPTPAPARTVPPQPTSSPKNKYGL